MTLGTSRDELLGETPSTERGTCKTCARSACTTEEGWNRGRGRGNRVAETTPKFGVYGYFVV